MNISGTYKTQHGTLSIVQEHEEITATYQEKGICKGKKSQNKVVGNWENNIDQGLFEWVFQENGDFTGKYKIGLENGTMKSKWNGTLLEKSNDEHSVQENHPNLNSGSIQKNGNIYIGQFINGELNGLGKLKFADGSIHEGEFKHGLLNGKGIIIDENGKLFAEGEFLDGDLNGKGKYYHENGTVFQEGIFTDGELNGHGLEYYDEDVYEGNWKSNEKCGQGKMTYTDGTIYEGEWLTNEIHGYGEMKWSNGQKYLGNWSRGNMHGKGKYFYSNGNIYEGDFVNGEFSGDGKFTYEDGSIYEGQFEADKFHGQGKMTYADGSIYVGEWAAGKKNGLGKMHFFNGDIFDGSWKEDVSLGLTKNELKLWLKKEREEEKVETVNNEEIERERKLKEIEQLKIVNEYERVLKEKELLRKQKESQREKQLQDKESEKAKILREKEKRIKLIEIERTKSESEKNKLRSFSIDYKIKLTKAIRGTQSKGTFFGTILGYDKYRTEKKTLKDKGEYIQRSITIKHNGTTISNVLAKHYVEEKDQDVKAGRAGTSTIVIISIKVF
jgi:hypothetical protein